VEDTLPYLSLSHLRCAVRLLYRQNSPLQSNSLRLSTRRSIWTDRQLVELTFLIAWEQCVARFNRALGIEADDVSGKQYCLVPEARVSSQFPLGEEQK
jgi:hypothetical protein